jgi:FOG: TPR repeat, SEL1 subfamily
MSARILGGLLSCICALAVAQAASAQSRPRYFDDIGRIDCAEGTERYLPGDYYFCSANKAMQAGNTSKARAMYEESARWGDKRAMFNLGLLLFRGEGLAKHEALGLAWLALAAERSQDQMQREVLVAAWTSVTPQVQGEANGLWNAMKLEYADRVTLARAQARYEREIRQLRRDLQRDPTMQAQIAGMGPQSEAGRGPMGQGSILLQTLDEAAAETILRPLPSRKGKVKVGTPEKVSEAAKPPAS